jgi:hypothetical protein
MTVVTVSAFKIIKPLGFRIIAILQSGSFGARHDRPV